MREALDLGDKKRLVAIHFCNGLGNFLQLTPAIQALGKLFDAKIDLILDRSWQDSRRQSVMEFCETRQWSLVNEVKDFQDGFDKDDYLQLFYSRHGERCEARQYFEEQCGYESDEVNWRSEKTNEVDYYMNEVYRLGYRGSVPSLYCIEGDNGPDPEGPVVNDVIENMGTFRIGFCNGYFTGSQWRWERKGWPHFGELARLLRKFLNPARTRICLFGKGQREQEWADSVMEQNTDAEKAKGITRFMDRDIRQVVPMMKRTHLLITTDTGLMHLADALRTPMVVLFGPTLVSKNGPYNEQHRIAKSPLRCAPCQDGSNFRLCDEFRCMNELKPWMVLKTVREYLHELYAKDEMGMNFRDGLSSVFSLVEE